MNGRGAGSAAVDAYIEELAEPAAALLREMRAIVLAEVPAGTECISYGIPTVDLDGRHLVHYAGYAGHVAMYPVNDVPAGLRRTLEPYLSGRATARFGLEEPLPHDVVVAIVHNQLRRHQGQAQQQ